MAVTNRVAQDDPPLSHNLLGQRLGRKGRGTRERILAAIERLLAGPPGTTISLSAVAREASLGMTTLYLYFGDLTELLLAVLDPIMVSAEESYLAPLRTRWPDAALAANCTTFVDAFQTFWARHARALHLRNSYSAGDERIVRHRIAAAQPLIDLITQQMDADPAVRGTLQLEMATVLVTGIERLVTARTDIGITTTFEPATPNVPHLLGGQAKLLELGIREGRAQARA